MNNQKQKVVLSRNNNSKIISFLVTAVWTLLGIIFIKADYELNDTLFYILLLSIPSLMAIYAVNAARLSQGKPVDGNFLFNSFASLILVDFAVIFIVYIATFSIG